MNDRRSRPFQRNGAGCSSRDSHSGTRRVVAAFPHSLPWQLRAAVEQQSSRAPADSSLPGRASGGVRLQLPPKWPIAPLTRPASDVGSSYMLSSMSRPRGKHMSKFELEEAFERLQSENTGNFRPETLEQVPLPTPPSTHTLCRTQTPSRVLGCVFYRGRVLGRVFSAAYRCTSAHLAHPVDISACHVYPSPPPEDRRGARSCPRTASRICVP